jgi:hypothetical protein
VEKTKDFTFFSNFSMIIEDARLNNITNGEFES